MRIAINGFGRIGRGFFKAFLYRKKELKNINIVAINDLTSPENLAYLLKYDSVYRNFPFEVSFGKNWLKILTKPEIKIPILAIPNPSDLPWRKLKIDLVIESTGRFTKIEDAAMHLKAGAKKVLVTAPIKKSLPLPKEINPITIVFGVNHNRLKPEHNIISCASCTTNCITPVMKIIKEKFGIKKAMMTTVHAFTADQRLQDAPHHKDFRRGRSAAWNIVPTTTGATKAASEAIPSLKNIFTGLAIRVPVICGSISDITIITQKPVSKEKVNQAFIRASKGKLKGILDVTNDPIVSSDILENPASSIVDLSLTNVIKPNLLKVIAWYDNEWGYSNRLIDVVKILK